MRNQENIARIVRIISNIDDLTLLDEIENRVRETIEDKQVEKWGNFENDNQERFELEEYSIDNE